MINQRVRDGFSVVGAIKNWRNHKKINRESLERDNTLLREINRTRFMNNLSPTISLDPIARTMINKIEQSLKSLIETFNRNVKINSLQYKFLLNKIKRLEQETLKTAQFKEGDELEVSAKKGEVRLKRK